MNRRRGVDDSSDEEPPLASNGDSAKDEIKHDLEDSGSDEGEGQQVSQDSSEESSDDEDELARVQKGLVASDEGSDNDSDEEPGDKPAKKRRSKRRRRQRSASDLELDEDDLDLLGLAQGQQADEDSSQRFKRLKRAGNERSGGSEERRGLDAMFDDEEGENDADSDAETAPRHRRGGEFDDFIEADEFDDEEAMRREEEREIGRSKRRAAPTAGGLPGLAAVGDLAGLDEEKLSEIYEVFGDGEMYNWALADEDEDDVDGAANPPAVDELQLTDVFEPSELAARMLTTEDNAIRSEDLPERYQLQRARLRHAYDLADEAEYYEKKSWIAEQMEAAARADEDEKFEIKEARRRAIGDVVDCIARHHLEIPYIWHHRQDFLLHFSAKDSSAERTQLLTLDDLWRIGDLDMDFHALIERRRALSKLRQQIEAARSAAAGSATNADEAADEADATNAKQDGMYNADLSELADFVAQAATGNEYQDLVDFVQFAASAQLRAARKHSRFAHFDRVRASAAAMELVEHIGVDVAALGALLPPLLPREPSKDSALTPSELAQELGASVDDAASFLAYSLSVDPRVRRFFRTQFETQARVNLVVTDDGRRKITENSPFADLKYSANWTLAELRARPALFLRMLRGEEQGLLIVRLQFPSYKTTLYADFEASIAGRAEPGAEPDAKPDADSWYGVRRNIAKMASRLIVPLVTRNILETLRSQSTRALRYDLRAAFADRLDQAPYKPPGYVLGTVPRALCVSSGEGGFGDAVLAAIVDEDGHVAEVVKLGDARSNQFRETLVNTVRDARPDVVGVAGFTPAARRLFQTVKGAIDEAKITTEEDESSEPLPVMWVQDEVARLYRQSERGSVEFPDLVPNARYCVALARYLQSPLLEYAQLDVAQLRNLLLHADQNLLPEDDFSWAVESAFVDRVCDVGVDINLALRSPYHAAVLPYVAGLGPRKAVSLLQLTQSRAKGGELASRAQLVTAEITPRIVFMNCASFLKIPWKESSTSSVDAEFLDSTRVHPEDYELARKMCADALELDEEDVEVVEEREPGGVVGKLVSEDAEGLKLDELVLEEYAEELEQLFEQRKRVMLDQIRREIQDPFRERRRTIIMLSSEQVFTMLTGETPKTFHRGSIVSGTVTKVTGRSLMLSLSGGIDGLAEAGNISDDRSVQLTQQFAPGQAVSAEVLMVDYSDLFARVNTRQSAVADAQKRLQHEQLMQRDAQHWNAEAEQRDIEQNLRRVEQQQRAMRVVKHPLFRPFSAREAEAYLAPLQRGDLVIRPSSRGMDHLVVTWKVADQIYQHIDVLEQDKINDYAVGRTLLVGPYKYADLDELIILHVQSMARKVDELTSSEKFQKGNRHDVERWLSAYTNARPTQSVYAFCLDHRRPGYFLLCFQLGASQPIKDVHVKVLPNGYELMRNQYPDVQMLCNGFKMLVQRSRV